MVALTCLPSDRDDDTESWALWLDLWAQAARNPAVGRVREEFDEHWRETLRTIVREGQASGEFRAIDADDFAVGFSALLDGLTIQIALEDPVVDARRAFRAQHASRCRPVGLRLGSLWAVHGFLRCSEGTGKGCAGRHEGKRSAGEGFAGGQSPCARRRGRRKRRPAGVSPDPGRLPSTSPRRGPWACRQSASNWRSITTVSRGLNMAGGEIRLVELVKQFSDVRAVDGINVEIDRGEFFSLLGPSGCGKTTTLRLIAGFEEPTSGNILLDGHDVAHLPAHKRNVNTVFQSYA